MPEFKADVGALRRLMAARKDYDVKKKALDKAKETRDAIELEVWEAIEASGYKGAVRVDLGEPWGVFDFKPNKSVRADIYDEDALETWAKANGFAEELIGVPTWRKAALNQRLKRALRAHGPMPAGVEDGGRKYVTVTDRNP